MPAHRPRLALLMALALTPGPARPAAPPPHLRADRHGDPLPPGAVARLGTLRLRHTARVRRAALSPDGKLLASSADPARVTVWDADTGRPLRRLATNLADLRSLAFSSDGKLLAAGGERVCLWEVRTGRRLFSVRDADAESYTSLAFSPDGKLLASGSSTSPRGKAARRGGAVCLWEVPGGRKLRLGKHADAVEAVAFAPGGKSLASGGHDRTVRIWHLAGGEAPHPFPGKYPCTAVAFSPDGRALAVGDAGGNVRLWDPATGRQTRVFEEAHIHWVGSLTFLAPALLASGGEYSRVRLWDLRAGKLHPASRALPPQVCHAAGSADGKTLALWGGDLWAGDQAVHLWDVRARREKRLPAGHTHHVTCVAFAPGGKLVASGGADGTLRLWDPSEGRQRRSWVASGGQAVFCVAFGPGGKTLASGGFDGCVRLWDPATGRPRRRWVTAETMVFRLAFSAGGGTLFSAGFSVVQAWDPDTGKLIRQLGTPPTPHGVGLDLRPPLDLAVTPDGRTAATVESGRLRLWDAPAGQELHPNGFAGATAPLAFSPDGRALAAGKLSSPNGRAVCLWETATGRERVRLEGPPDDCRCLAFSPDARLVAAGCGDGAVRVWGVATGKQLRLFRGHSGPVRQLAWSPGGRALVSAGSDTTLLVWDTAGLADAPAPPPAPQEVRAWWVDLAGADAGRAARVIWAMASHPRQALPLLGDRLRPEPSADPRRVACWIAELDSDDFATREQATRALERARASAEPALRKALAKPPSHEVRHRARRLLAKCRADWHSPSPELLRALRALEALERMGTHQARQVLEALAKGAPEARLTREAKSALARLEARAGRP